MDILTWCLGACVGAGAGGASVLVLVLADLARDAPPAEGFPHSSSPCVFLLLYVRGRQVVSDLLHEFAWAQGRMQCTNDVVVLKKRRPTARERQRRGGGR